MENGLMDEGLEAVAREADVNTGVVEQFLKKLPEQALHLGIRVVFAAIVLFIGLQLIKLIRKILKKSLQRTNADVGAIQFLDSLIKVSLTVLLFLMIATSFGLDAASVMALVGSAGVAFGLALQGSLSNFAGGVLILLLKPFVVGDYIIEGNKGQEGTVTEIQMFYTKLLTVDDKVVILPNGTLANNSITNVTATDIRRLDLKIGISYSSDIEKAKTALKQVMDSDSAVLLDKEKLVYVDELSSSSVILGLRCWFKNETYWEGKWRITENSKIALDQAEIEIPFPQLDVKIKK